MTNLVQRILSTLDRRPWRLVLEKQNATFVLGAFRGNKRVAFANLLTYQKPANQLCEFLQLDGDTTVVPMHHVFRTRRVLREIGSETLHVEISAEVASIRVDEVPKDFVVSYSWCDSRGCIARTIGIAADYCGDGWFLSGDSGWCVRGLDGSDDSWLNKATIGGQDIVTFLQHVVVRWQGKGWPIVCDLKYSTDPIFTFVVRYVCDDYLDCAVDWNADASAVRCIPSLPNHVWANGVVRPGVLPQSLAGHVPRDSQPFRVNAQQLPVFLRDVWPRIRLWATGAVAALEQQHRILTDLGTLSLTVAPVERRGMGVVLATPVFVCGNLSQPAEQVSRQLDAQTEFIRWAGAWLPAKTIKQAGIGPLGRLSDGTPLTPITLTAIEVLKRGSARLDGPWARIDFPDLTLPHANSSSETGQRHLAFLHRWRIPGGIIGDLGTYQSAFLNLLIGLVNKQTGIKILVIASKKALDRLDHAWPQAAAALFTGNRTDPSPTPPPSGLILATSKAIETVPELTKARWDLICILEADSLIKSPRSKFYLQLGSCPRSLTIGLFSGNAFLKRTPAREAMSHTFRIPGGDDGDLLWKYGLRDPRQKAPPLPQPYRLQVKSRSPQPGIQPAEMVIESQNRTSGAVSIPPRATTTTPAPIQTSRRVSVDNSGVYVQVRYSISADQFVLDARNLVNRRETRARFVPFQCYWPTYSSMTREQQRWYFYWRAQVRQGHYPDTALSYIFVYVYELINEVGVKDARDGYERLRQLWRHYRDRFPKLDNYLIDWLADYAVVNRPGLAPLEIYAEALALDANVASVDLILPTYLGAGLGHLPLSIIEALSNYKVRRSRFYTDGNHTALQEGVLAAIEVVDDHLRQHFGGGIFDLFNPGTAVPVRRQAFQSARYSGSARNISLGQIVPFSEHAPLREFLTAVVKHAENTLRKQAGFAGKLRGYTLEPEFQAAIEECLGVVQPVESVAPAPPRVQIDLARVQALTSESDQVRDMLLTSPLAEDAQVVPESAHLVPGQQTSTGPAGARKGLLTDLAPVRAILSRLSASEKSVLMALLESGGQMNTTELAQAFPDILLEATIDVVNDLALAHLGDILIAEEAGEQVLADDYCDELEHLLTDPQVGADAEHAAEASSLPPEWIVFRRQLADHELAVLEAIVRQEDSATIIRQIADANATMPGTLLDSINQTAMDTIGDIILDAAVDPPVIEDEDMDMVRQLLAEAADN